MSEQNYVQVPRIRIYGVGDRSRLLPFQYTGQIGTEITNLNGQYRDIHRNSITLADHAALFQTYLRNEFPSDLGEVELPDDVKKVLRCLFGEEGCLIVTNDACDYDHGDQDMRRVKPTDRRVRWVVGPQNFEGIFNDFPTTIRPAGYEWSVTGGKEYLILIPEPGYTELTVDGLLRPDTGTPFSTVETREEAEASFMARRFPLQLARMAVSYFESREEGEGISSVICGYINDRDGRFSIDVSNDPAEKWNYTGSFASRTVRREKG